MIDPTFGVSGATRAGEAGIDRIALLFDGSIAAAAPGLLQRLEPNGAPVSFPGAEVSAVRVGHSYRMSAMVALRDGQLIAGALHRAFRFLGAVSYIRIGCRSPIVGTGQLPARLGFYEVGSFARDRDGLIACGNGSQSLIVQRWLSDGTPDPAFALATGGRVNLAVDDRPQPLVMATAPAAGPSWAEPPAIMSC